MPYKNNNELPDSVKNVLPGSAQSIFRRAYNTTSKANPSYNEERLAKIAWTAVKNAGYKKGKNDKWMKESIKLDFKKIGTSWSEGCLIMQSFISNEEITENFLDEEDIETLELSNNLTLMSLEMADGGYNVFALAIPESNFDLEGVELYTID